MTIVYKDNCEKHGKVWFYYDKLQKNWLCGKCEGIEIIPTNILDGDVPKKLKHNKDEEE